MARTTLANAKDPTSGIARVLNLSPTDDRFIGYLNEAQQRLVQTGELFYGLFARYALCVSDGAITWPRHVAAIEAIAVSDCPITIRNEWFEFLQSASGLQDDCSSGSTGCCGGCGGTQLYDRGNACTFADIIGENKKIKVYADVAEDADAQILLQGMDENGNWIRTQVGGEWIDGEFVSISTTPQFSTKTFSCLVAVQKPETNGNVRLYEYNTVLTTQRALAVYEPSETNPSYRRSFIGNLGNNCENVQVTIMAKLEFIPAKVDKDWLLIGNLPAIKDMCQSIRKSENNEFDQAVQWEARAVQALRRELSHYRGHGVVQPIRLTPRHIGGPSVMNMQ